MDMEGAQKEKSKFYETLSTAASSAEHDPQGAHQTCHSHQGLAHTIEKIVSGSTVEKDKTHYCKGYRERYRAGGYSLLHPTTSSTNNVATYSKQRA